MEWSIYNYMYYSEKAQAYLLYSSLSNMFVKLNQEAYETIIKIKNDPNCIEAKDRQYRFLFDKRFIVESNENERNKIVLSAITQRFNPDVMSLTIAPTQACNFNCPYCYEGNKAKKKMTDRVQSGIIDFLKRKKNIKKLNVIWYGGEPTLAIDVIRKLSNNMQAIINNYSSYMITNGYNIDKIVDFVDELKIGGMQITLDGTKKSHDSTRYLVNGKGSFDKILSNIDLLLSVSNKVNITVRMNVLQENSKEYEPLYRLLRLKYNKRVNLYPAFVKNYIGREELGECYDDSRSKASFLKNLYYNNRVYAHSLYPTRVGKGCMCQSLNAFVVGASGELYKCWHHLGLKDKIVGSIFKPDVITDYALFADMMIKNDALFDEKCISCVLFPSCDGGCIDLRNTKEDCCIPAKSMLEDFLDIRYLLWAQSRGIDGLH
ncbi:radical SAM/SPASM domain-containing protein [Tannerella forsythia]|uniref:radical SAM/SPASM domain-containing protein n=1 Tax=Tannerella forsythia TaxID=28112 RepID=UPI0028ED6FD5|nr:radical SAM protein [Tannerella forsythia]